MREYSNPNVEIFTEGEDKDKKYFMSLEFDIKDGDKKFNSKIHKLDIGNMILHQGEIMCGKQEKGYLKIPIQAINDEYARYIIKSE